MKTKSEISLRGKDLMVRVPPEIVRELDLRDGKSVSLRTIDGDVIVESLGTDRLAARLATVREREAEVGAPAFLYSGRVASKRIR